ncbi:uncharacterized protein F5891DRAFT_982151 [Suillus fuscotomentosus]|uniref:Uncharacterized protein n=1 Tax=Suillus fuscotomentosus TaxID=1912939 RepID=A0AAD4E448_9AGAM|nr:uncharacterized protein F5891DRAFT_982151 [Suillus fuscotomentosus]KAG1897948.1 hypothetical protein F5891DRAFT_982151 [Suillus fuscotomentosus]
MPFSGTLPSHPMNNHLAFCACPFIAALRNLYLILGYTHHITSAHHIIYTCGCSLYGDQTIGLFPRRTIKIETLAAFLLDPATSYRMFHQGRISMGLPTDLQRLFWSSTATKDTHALGEIRNLHAPQNRSNNVDFKSAPLARDHNQALVVREHEPQDKITDYTIESVSQRIGVQQSGESVTSNSAVNCFIGSVGDTPLAASKTVAVSIIQDAENKGW